MSLKFIECTATCFYFRSYFTGMSTIKAHIDAITILRRYFGDLKLGHLNLNQKPNELSKLRMQVHVPPYQDSLF